MNGVVKDEHGTGRAARVPGLEIGGKTGTAQVISLPSDEEKMDDVPMEERPHAWFVAFAPVSTPEIAVAALVEHGGHGGSAAAPLTGKMIEANFGLKGGNLEETAEERAQR